MGSRYDTIEKIRKLFALGDVNQSHTTEGEATNAMKLGLKLMYEHKISPLEIFGTQQASRSSSPSFDDVFGSRVCKTCPSKDTQIMNQSRELDTQRIKLRDLEARLRASETGARRQQMELDTLKAQIATNRQPEHMPDLDLIKAQVRRLADLLAMRPDETEDQRKPFRPLVPRSVSESYILQGKSLLVGKPWVLDSFETEFLASVIERFDRGILLTEKQQTTLENVIFRNKGRTEAKKVKVNRGKTDDERADEAAKKAAQDFEDQWKSNADPAF